MTNDEAVRDRRATDISPEEQRERMAEAIRREAEAQQADERERLKTYGIAAFGAAGLLIAIVGFLVFRSIPIGSAGATMGMGALGIFALGKNPFGSGS